MDNEVDLSRYSAGLRRHRRVIIGAACLGAVVGIIFGVLTPFVSTGVLVAVDRSAELAAAGVKTSDLDRRPVYARIATTLDADSFESALDADVEVGARALPLEVDGSVAVDVSGGSAAAVEDAMAALVTEASGLYAAEMRDLIGRIEENSDRAAESANAQIARLEQQLETVDESRTTLIDGLLVQIEELRVRAVTASDNAAALRRFQEGLEGDVLLQQVETPEKSRSLPVLTIAGAVAAAILAAAAVVVSVAIDTRVRSRRDLDRIGLRELVGVVSSAPTDAEIDILAGAIAQAARRSGRGAVQLVPVSGSADTQLAERLQRALGDLSINARSSLDDAADTMRHADTMLSIALVSWGRDDRVEVATVANRLAAASGTDIGVVFVAVPKRELHCIER